MLKALKKADGDENVKFFAAFAVMNMDDTRFAAEFARSSGGVFVDFCVISGYSALTSGRFAFNAKFVA